MTAALKSKQTSIATVRNHLRTLASFLTPLIYHWSLPLIFFATLLPNILLTQIFYNFQLFFQTVLTQKLFFQLLSFYKNSIQYIEKEKKLKERTSGGALVPVTFGGLAQIPPEPVGAPRVAQIMR